MTENSRDVEKGHQHHTAPVLDYDSNGSTGLPRRRLANPGPVGLFAFATTTFLLSMFNVNTRGIHTPNVVIGMAIFAGGLVQLLAGMWEIPNGNAWGATAFSSYGAFWLSYATIFIPASGVMDAFKGREDELNNAIGMYLMAWFMVTVMFIPPTLRRNLALPILLSVLAMALLLLSIGAWNQMPSVNKAGGVFGIITGLIAWYIGLSELMRAEKAPLFMLPLGDRSGE